MASSPFRRVSQAPVDVTLQTSLSVDECVRRITAAVDPMTWRSRAGIGYFKPVAGEVNDFVVELKRRHPWNVHTPVFRWTLVPHQEGTTIRGVQVVGSSPEPLLPIWLLGVASLGGLSTMASISDWASGRATFWSVCLSVSVMGFLLLVGFTILYQWRLMAEHDAEYLLAFLQRTLDARVAGPEASR